MNTTIKLETFWLEKNTQWETSGITQQKFCEQHGLVYGQFAYWRGRLKQRQTIPQEPKLLKVLIPSAPQQVSVSAEGASCLEVLLPTGIKLYIKEDADITKAGALIQFLGGA